MNEAPYGEHLSVYGTTDDTGAHLFRSLREDGKTNVEAMIELLDVE